MSTYFDPDKHAKTVEIPVKVRKGNKIEFFYEGDLPDIQDGALCRLIVPAYAIKENSKQRQLSEDKKIPFLPVGSIIFMAVNIDKPDKVSSALLQEHQKAAERLRQSIKNRSAKVILGNGPVEIILKDNLSLTLRGTKRAKLESCRCVIPLLGTEAISLNQAYSLISQELEKHRASHTGSAFRAMYHFDPKNGGCISLDELRNRAEGEDEKERFQVKRM